MTSQQQQPTGTVNGIDLDDVQETVEALREQAELSRSKFRVSNKWVAACHNQTQVNDFHAGGEEHAHREPYELHADEPPMLGGQDQAPNPVEHLLNALAGCLTTSLVAHAAVRGIQLDEVESQIEGDIDLRGFLGLDPDVPKGYSNIRVRFTVKADGADADQLRRLAEFSPVYNTVTHGAAVDVQVELA